MKISQHLKLLSAAALAFFATTSPQTAQAELIVGLTTSNSLISFDSAAPGTILNNATITGIVMGDTLIGIDRRASLGVNNAVLYGLGVSSSGVGRIYTFNTTTGLATPGATLFADPMDMTAPTPYTSIMGSSFGFDFNPVPDRLRVTSDTGQNLRINVDTGATQLDGFLAYGMMDPNFGSTPNVTAVAYSNSFGGATSTMLRGVDLSPSNDRLVLITNPNGGVLATALTLPFDSTAEAGYDISGRTGTPFFSATSNGVSSLYAAGPGGVQLVGAIGGGVTVRDIAASPVPEPGTIALAAVGISAILLRRRFLKA